MLKNSDAGFGYIAIAMHWLTALAVLGLFALGLWMVDLDYYSSWYQDAPHIHKSVGILLAALILMRLLWRSLHSLPEAIGNHWEKVAATCAHWLMYCLLIALFGSGYLISTADGRAISVFGWFNVPSLGELIADQEDVAGLLHEYIAYILIAIVSMHVLAAFKHHFINKDRTLVRMLKPLDTRNPQSS